MRNNLRMNNANIMEFFQAISTLQPMKHSNSKVSRTAGINRPDVWNVTIPNESSSLQELTHLHPREYRQDCHQHQKRNQKIAYPIIL